MKSLLITLVLFFSGFLMAQEVYQVNGESLPLYTEVEGPVTFLWNSIDGNYRYFIKKDETITELKNTSDGRNYKEEYKEVLKTLVGPEKVKDVKLTRPDLAKLIDYYNAASDPAYQITSNSVLLKTRLGGFTGMTNYPYAVVNPENTLLLQLGAEFEIIDEVKLKRHSLVFQFRQIFGTSDYDFNSTQLNFNYRFKFVYTDAFDIFINAKVAGYNYVSQDIDIIDNDVPTNISGSGGAFQAPFALGLGSDIALGRGYLTIQIQDLIALNLDDNGDFPVDVAVGYKWNL